MGKTARIIVTCPETGVLVITRMTYADMAEPDKRPRYFTCPCGETHKLAFAGKHSAPQEPPPADYHRVG
jgi:hypothetical protein